MEKNLCEMEMFGVHEEFNNLWCHDCWNKLQEYIERKRFEDRTAELVLKLNEILKISDEQNKKLISVISKTNGIIKDLEKFTRQMTLKF